MTTEDVLAEVAAERARQERLLRDGKLEYTAASVGCPDVLRVAALGEEYGEVCRALHDDTENLREELIHTAAVAVAWAEALPQQLTLGAA